MNGARAKPTNKLTIKIPPLIEEPKMRTFYPIFPRNVVIKDIMLCRPYQKELRLKVGFLDDESELVLLKDGLLTDKLHTVNLAVSGVVPCIVWSAPEKVIVRDNNNVKKEEEQWANVDEMVFFTRYNKWRVY